MKKLFFILLLTSHVAINCFSQTIGGNGEGLTKVISQEDIPYLIELIKNNPIAIRWPGGGDSKVAFPTLDKPGLGMNKDSIYKLYDEFRDKKGDIKDDKLEKDLLDYEKDITRRSALIELIELSKQIKNLQVDFCLNVLQGNIETNISALQTLIDSGVNIISIVAGNETFYSYKYNWEKYKNDFEPILKECEKRFPQIPRLLCIAQDFNLPDQKGWNGKLINYINSTGKFISGVDVHYYYFEEIKSAIDIHPGTVVFKPDVYYKDLDKAFAKYIELYKAQDKFTPLVQYLNTNLPGKIYHCTEFGDKNAENWSNTIANAGHIFEIFCKHRNDFQILLVQNLIANWYWAARRPVGKFDDNPDNKEKMNCCQWYSIQLANELPTDATELKLKNEMRSKGTYYFYFNNAGNEKYDPEFNFKNSKIKSFEIHYVTGKYNYSSAGQTGFMAKGSEKSCEVKGIKIINSDKIVEVPYNSFGYVKIVTE